MSTWLKQSTAVDVKVGPFLDDTDGKTAETALAITQPDIRLAKNGGAFAQKNAAQTLTHEEAGWYEVALDTTDTNTLGILIIAIHEAGALPVWREFMVLPADVYDALVSDTGAGVHANVQAIAAGAITAASIATGAIDADALATDTITAAKIAADAITSAKIATDAIGSDELAAGAADKIRDSVWNKAMTELTAIPAMTASVFDAFRHIFNLSRNRIEQTSSTQTLKRADDTTTVGSGSVSDDGTTAVRGRLS